jgi:hypothetical protein
MKILYGIQPDLCIANSELVIQNSQDVVLPKYFYLQLLYLKNSNLGSATYEATKIIDSLLPISAEDLLIFQTSSGGKIYFHDQEISLSNYQRISDNLDFRNPFDRYLLSLAKISEILDAKVVFITSSSEIFSRCRFLHFDIGTIEEFSSISGESWLQPERILNIQAMFDPMTQIQWQEEETEEPISQGNDINWIEITHINLDREDEGDLQFENWG